MATWVAFLRAINLGATRKFPKDAIVAATEAAGFTGVATHINTGNVRLETSMRSRTRIESALEAAYEADRGFAVPTIAFTVAELREVAATADQVGAGHDGRHYVWLLKHEPDAAAVEAFTALAGGAETVHVEGRAAHLLLPTDYLASRASDIARVEKLVGPATNRNVTVVRAVTAKWC
ncbi:DUF1697 domain-containing protein [Nocardioides litoris]|uniref:DUF1697 domain-containing protein n=1 Tax=Nocardioides litoris TaxID=1926648 RepID=UPI00111EDB23|nr:DUF1697 domain-containing protein [Nocardioides litoris]